MSTGLNESRRLIVVLDKNRIGYLENLIFSQEMEEVLNFRKAHAGAHGLLSMCVNSSHPT